jgi:hypothetical protein
MRLRHFVCFALVAGLLAFAITTERRHGVVVTYLRSEDRDRGRPWRVFAIRNDTDKPVTFIDLLPLEGPIVTELDSPRGSCEIKPHSTMELRAKWVRVEPPHLINVYVVPWTSEEKFRAGERYSKLPKFIREWLMRKYEPHLPAYGHQGTAPVSALGAIARLAK